MKESKSPYSHPCDVTLLEDTTPVQEVVKEFKSSYAQAREYIERYHDLCSRAPTTTGSLDIYEKTFSIGMTIGEWFKLSDDLNLFESDQTYPRYSYYSPTSTLTIQCMATHVHESIISIFMRGFIAVQESLPDHLSSKMNATAGQKNNGFEGNYTMSNKTADLAVEFKNDAGDFEVKFVLEVGYSETYEDLVRDAKLWLEGNHKVSVVVLVNFEETPSYRCPIRDEDFTVLEFPSIPEVKTMDFELQEEYGPVVYKGLQWVGHISAAYMEVWKRHTVTGLATKNGNRINLHTAVTLPRLKFRVSDFIEIPLEDDREISFKWDQYRILVKCKIKELGAFRYRQMLKRRAKLLEGIEDPDYQP